MSIVLGVVALFVLTAATGYFVAQEFAYVAADRAALTNAAEQGDGKARRALEVMGRLSFMLSGAQLGITVTGLVVGLLSKPALADLLRPLLGWMGVPDGAVGAIAVAVGFAIATVVQMVMGELIPKNWALARAEAIARVLASSTLAYLAVAGPVIRLFDNTANRLLRAVGIEPAEELHHGATLEELSDIIGESHRAGHLPADLSAVLERALTFGERTADEAMVPRPKVITVAAGDTVAELTEHVRRSGHTNYPVYGADVDDIVGVAGVRELADHTLTPDTPVGRIARPALLVPGSQPLYGVIERMRETGEEFACVVDEYGGLAGILTFEDIAEELVGEISDENDVAETASAAVADGDWTVDAALRIDEVAALTGLELPEDEVYDTLGGLVISRLGRLPRPGDRVVVELDPTEGQLGEAEIEVLSVARRVPREVRVRVLATAGGEG
ncbi:Hemolysin, contains CBS domains [Thermomonospora echinospora]|uniref:Hemolysin, contains CBS domains n=1 Tax=Thermomonospora echinospora TaxID=1992 RepID=A0A1H6CA51_9ACTN|nr:hemolysin family protein [Thermomonospora echinospora]SEG69505.1 Hemolysin, contains CBS domains [Thermomonospora echinospora]